MEGVVTYSEIKRWRFCRQAHYYQFVEKLFPKRKPKPLKIGAIVHELIESWALGENYKNILTAVKKEYKGMFEEEKEFYGDIPQTVERIIGKYVELYSSERRQYRLVEHLFSPIPLTSKTEFKFKIDRLLKTKDELYLCETKTGRKIPEEEIRLFDLQTLLYVWGLREHGENITAILWDYIRTKTPAVPQLLKNGTISTRANIDTDYETFMSALKANKCNPKQYTEILSSLRGNTNRFFKRVKLPVSERMIAPVVADAKRTSLEILYLADKPIRSMSGFTCPRCQYQSLCYAVLKGLDEEFLRENEYTTKRKEEHEKETEEDITNPED